MTRNDLQFNATCVLSENRLPRNYPRVNHDFFEICHQLWEKHWRFRTTLPTCIQKGWNMLKPAVTAPGGLVHRGLSVAVGSLGFQMAIMQPGAANGNQTWKVPHVYPRAVFLLNMLFSIGVVRVDYGWYLGWSNKSCKWFVQRNAHRKLRYGIWMCLLSLINWVANLYHWNLLRDMMQEFISPSKPPPEQNQHGSWVQKWDCAICQPDFSFVVDVLKTLLKQFQVWPGSAALAWFTGSPLNPLQLRGLRCWSRIRTTRTSAKAIRLGERLGFQRFGLMWEWDEVANCEPSFLATKKPSSCLKMLKVSSGFIKCGWLENPPFIDNQYIYIYIFIVVFFNKTT